MTSFRQGHGLTTIEELAPATWSRWPSGLPEADWPVRANQPNTIFDLDTRRIAPPYLQIAAKLSIAELALFRGGSGLGRWCDAAARAEPHLALIATAAVTALSAPACWSLSTGNHGG